MMHRHKNTACEENTLVLATNRRCAVDDSRRENLYRGIMQRDESSTSDFVYDKMEHVREKFREEVFVRRKS